MRGEDRVWTPTLYLGLMPLLIALITWRLRTPDRRIGWLSWIACGSLIASFGWYGPGWLIGTLQTAWTGEPTGGALGEPTGGLYWLMVTTLPGYAYFRYPAKLLVITSLAVALLAAIGFERLLTSDRRRLRRCLAVLGIGSAVAVCVLRRLRHRVVHLVLRRRTRRIVWAAGLPRGLGRVPHCLCARGPGLWPVLVVVSAVAAGPRCISGCWS